MEKLRQTLRVRKERAILVAANLYKSNGSDGLAELTALAESAGAVVADRFQQRIRTINPSTYIGKGKALQLGQRVRRFKADVIIFDNDLSPAQIRELEKITETKVLDRSELILDIFATRAKTKQAKPQVALAVNARTFLPVFMPLAPAGKLLDRLPDEIVRILALHGVDQGTIDAARAEMADVRIAPTNDRSVVGVMTEFAFLGEHFFEGDLTALSLRMASTPVGPLRATHRFPDQALAAVLADRSSGPEAHPEHMARIIAFPGQKMTGPS